ncbi:MAG: discoidin domain-containing protein, partial [Lachnospiraceae bacterium]|nr:discoidin domain-containing protein [Lachnospiraceae bacterium]
KFNLDGTITCLNDTEGSAVTWEKNKWYDVVLKLDLEKQTYDLSINEGDNAVVTKKGLNLGAVDKLSWIQFPILYSAKSAIVLLDDMVVNSVTIEQMVNVVPRGDDQVKASNSPIIKFESKALGALAIVNSKDAYETWATSSERGVMLADNRTAFIVRDEVTLKAKSDVYWFAHSERNIEIELSTDKKSAILTDENGNRMWVGILTTDGEFEVRDCTPLPGSPKLEGQVDNSKFQKLTIKFAGVESVNVAVAYIPLVDSVSVPENLATIKELGAKNLAYWQIPDGELPSVDTITLNGVEIEGFTPTKTLYTISIRDDETIPIIAATKNGVSLEVQQATTDSPTAVITFIDGGTSNKIRINFNIRSVLKKVVQGYEITEDDISIGEDGILEEANPPKAVLDGNLTTRWTSKGRGQYMIIDFGQVRTFSKLDIAMYNSEKRTYLFEIKVSEDGFNYTSVYNGPDQDVYADGTHLGPVAYDFGGTYQARYIKIIVNSYEEAASHDLYNNIAEIQ